MNTCQYIPLHIPSVRIRTKTCYISTYVQIHTNIKTQYMPIHTTVHTHTYGPGTLLCGANRTRIGMYFGMYWYVWVCIWYVIARILVRFNPVGEDVAYVWVCTVVCICTYFFTDMYKYISIRTIHTCTCQYGLRQSSPRAAVCAPARQMLYLGVGCRSLTVGNSRAWLSLHVRAQEDSQQALSWFERSEKDERT